MADASSRLIVRTGPNPGTVFDLTKEVTMLGRDVTNDIPIGDAEISRQHARLTRTPGGVVLEDLGSTNGSFVNGERLASPRLLRAGDTVGFGENVTLSFESTAPEAAATVMGPAARPAPAPRPAAPPPPRVVSPAAGPGAVEPMPTQEGGGGRSRWLLAGCGCLLVLLACAGLFAFMDSYYPDILYSPLRMFGFGR
ncbi:MAG TPA: FHA domain-containing protein [Anaerolineales bacterium]|nr:FHA domain-containing protein [Anaerolineales bacterium]